MSSVEVASTVRAHRKQRHSSTEADSDLTGRVVVGDVAFSRLQKDVLES